MIKKLVVLLCLICFSTSLKAAEISETAENNVAVNGNVSADSSSKNTSKICLSDSCENQNDENADTSKVATKDATQGKTSETAPLADEISYAPTQVQQSQNNEVALDYGNKISGDIKYVKMKPEEDIFYSGKDEFLLETENSEEDDLFAKNNLETTAELEPSKISCDLPQLKEQIKNFMYQKTKDEEVNSVIEKRSHILLVQNLHDFKEVSSDTIDTQKDFATASTIANLRINNNIVISKICLSSGNTSKKFNNLYVIIYPYLNYYKVVVPNLAKSQDKLDDATFIFNW